MALKETQSIRAQLSFIGELEIYSRKSKMDYSKIMIDLITHDDQKIFGEVRNSKIPLIQAFKKGDIVDVEYIFAGSEKNGKKYNNLIVVNLERI